MITYKYIGIEPIATIGAGGLAGNLQYSCDFPHCLIGIAEFRISQASNDLTPYNSDGIIWSWIANKPSASGPLDDTGKNFTHLKDVGLHESLINADSKLIIESSATILVQPYELFGVHANSFAYPATVYVARYMKTII